MAVPQPLLYQRLIFRAVEDKNCQCLHSRGCRIDQDPARFCSFVQLFKKNNFEKPKVRFLILGISNYMCVLLLF